MEDLGRYVLSVISAAVIGGIVSSMMPSKGSAGALLRMLCGLFLAFVVIAPLGQLNYDVLAAFSTDYIDAGEAAAVYGEELSREYQEKIIKQETEAYILDKAAAYGAEMTVEVTVSEGENPLPEHVILRGSISPYAKSQLQSLLETQLGIPKENQQWIS